MSTTAVELRAVAGPGRVGQGTAVEQSRAVAEVQAAVIVAQQCPRSVAAAVQAMEEACRQPALASRAFFRYPRAGETVSGPSVHLARELARCWGNVQHGITELLRDDVHGQSEMQAWAWDVQTNTRSSNTFIVQHKRDTRNGVKDLTDQRDIYENNANNGARRLREAIFSVLPTWYAEQAKELCQRTNEDGGGRPLAVRVTEAVRVFERYRVSPARLAAKFGYASVDELTGADVAQLGVIYDSLKQGTVTVDDEFPAEPDRVTAAELTAQAAAKPARARTAAKPKTAEPDTPDPSPAPAAAPAATAAPAPRQGAGEDPAAPEAQPVRPASPAQPGQVGAIRGHFTRLGWSDSEEDRVSRLDATAKLAGHDGDLLTTKDLTASQAAQVIRALVPCITAQDLLELLSDGTVPGGA